MRSRSSATSGLTSWPGTSGCSSLLMRASWRRSDRSASSGARVLDLDRDLAAVVPHRAVHLPDAGGRGGRVVELAEPLGPAGGRTARRASGGRRGSASAARRAAASSATRGTGPPARPARAASKHRQRLTELHRAALELAQHGEQLLGAALLDLAHHRLGRLAAEPLAEPERVATGVPQERAPSGPSVVLPCEGDRSPTHCRAGVVILARARRVGQPGDVLAREPRPRGQEEHHRRTPPRRTAPARRRAR